MRVARLILMVLWVWGCGDDDGSPGDAGPIDSGPPDSGPPDGGPSCTEYTWDPASGVISTWPEPLLVVDDPTTATGKRLHFDPVRFPDLARVAAGYLPVLTDGLGDLDGFGVNSEIVFRFNRHFDEVMIPEGDASMRPDAGLGIVVLEPGPPRLVPVLVRLTDEDTTLLISPMRPLPPQALVAAFVTRDLTGAARGCLEPSAAFTAALAAPDPDQTTALAALATLGVAADPEEVIAMTVFPTQTTTDDDVAVAEDVAGRTYTLDGTPVCTPSASWILCETAFVAQDFRDAADGVIRRAHGSPAEPVASYRIPIAVWLPVTGTAPFPTMVFGHGLGGDRYQAQRLAEFAAPRGIATVAIDAVQHGNHPTVEEPTTDTLVTVFRFFAIDRTEQSVDSLKLRDHFRQSAYDKLQLTHLLRTGLDLDGDMVVDLDPDRLGYLGVSLGGIMGPELLALTDAYGVAVLVVPGGRVSAIISDSDTFGPLILLLRPRGVTEGDIARFFPILQTVIDRGDAASYAPRVLADRFPAAGAPPSLLLGIVLDDNTVPNLANYGLARGFGDEMTIIPPILRPEPGLPMGPMPPVMGNAAGGTVTAGVLQFDVIREGTTIEQATHSNVGDSEVGAEAWFEFIDRHWNAGMAVIVDPYAETMLEHGRGPGERCMADSECRMGTCIPERTWFECSP